MSAATAVFSSTRLASTEVAAGATGDALPFRLERLHRLLDESVDATGKRDAGIDVGGRAKRGGYRLIPESLG